jgi:tetratricopeptide (TPR) repeat protein
VEHCLFCDEALRKYPEGMLGTEELIRTKGVCHFALERLDEAKSAFDEAIRRRPNFAKVYFCRG